MQNEEGWDDIFCGVEEQEVKSYRPWDSPEEFEDDVEVFFMMVAGL